MNKNDMTQIKNVITMPSEMADALLQGCTASRAKRFPYTRYSGFAMAIIAAFALIITGSTSYAAYNVYQEKNLAVFMEASLSQTEIDRIGEELMQIPGISSCHFVSGDEAWNTFQKEYLEGLDYTFNENPLKGSFNYRLSVRLNADTQAVREQIGQLDGVRLVQDLSELKNQTSLD